MNRYTIAAAFLLFGCASQSAPVKPADSTPAPAPAAPPAAKPAPPPAAATPPASVSGMRSTLMGVFTDAQATAGKDLYLGRCQSCHTGEHSSPAFRVKWNGRPIARLWSLIRETMPDDDPGGLSDEAYSQVVAYLLKLNGLPAGATALPADSVALKNIRFDTLTKR